jgi:methyl coenzyme M reductase alpha subunit
MKTQNIFIAHPKTDEQVSALKAFMQALKIKFEISKEEDYNPDFIAKIEESRQQYKKGEFVSVVKKDIKSFLGLE